MNAQLLHVKSDDPLHRLYMAEVYRWAKARPEAYLDGTGYDSREEFLEPPPGAQDFIVLLEGQPSALLTLLPLGGGEYGAGLIVSPTARIRRLMATLRCVRGWLPNAGVTALRVVLPMNACYDGARNMAARLGFVQKATTDWKLEITDGNTRQAAGS